ncbi:hypothetical protein LCGC14_2188310 [marine sediment metagenome]|uniref:Uncharacterized protein n=1 Tax=marine sediment metagenome TaxID=412755 RepID=A0A0F9DKH2_9ZZZZ
MNDTIETALPPQRRLYMDGNMWCAVGLHFRNLAIDDAGFGETQKEAVANLNTARRENNTVEDFEIGGFCRQCKVWVEDGLQMDGCRDPDCPCME